MERLSPAERSAGYEEWADFYEWRCEHAAAESADDRGMRRLVEEWTESMAYCCRRSAARARGEDPASGYRSGSGARAARLDGVLKETFIAGRRGRTADTIVR
jgi:hypothetical protein